MKYIFLFILICANAFSVPYLETGQVVLGGASNAAVSSPPSTGFVETFSGYLTTPAVENYVLEQYAEFAFTVNRITSKCVSGTADFDLEIDGTDVTGCSSQQMSSSEAVDTCTAANTVAAGATFALNVTAISSAASCAFTVKITRN